MPRRSDIQTRVRLAQEAARIMREQAIQDFGTAKRKARERLGLADTVPLPKNTEIEAELRRAQSLFDGDDHAARIGRLRAVAGRAMRVLAEFRPRLVGPVLAGTATEHAAVNLHLFADPAERVALALMERGIDYRSFERRLRMRNGEPLSDLPGFAFSAEGVELELTVFPEISVRQAPLSPVDGRPMRRASLRELEALLAAGD